MGQIGKDNKIVRIPEPIRAPAFTPAPQPMVPLEVPTREPAVVR